MQQYKLKSGNILKVYPDNNPISPSDDDNEYVFLVYDHRQFSVSVNGFVPIEIYDYLQECKKETPNLEDVYNFSEYYIFTVYAYIHSGVCLSLGNSEYPFNDRWDTSTTGFILVKKQMEETAINYNLALNYAENLIEEWNTYLSGDVYQYSIYKVIKTYTITEDDLMNIFDKEKQAIDYTEFKNIAIEGIEKEEIDSCGNFYGSDIKTNGILEMINDELIEEI